MTAYLFNPPAIPSLPIQGRDERFPINRLFFVGDNGLESPWWEPLPNKLLDMEMKNDTAYLLSTYDLSISTDILEIVGPHGSNNDIKLILSNSSTQ